MGKGFNNYMCKKFFHPASRDNLKRFQEENSADANSFCVLVWMAEQKSDSYKKKQEELRVQYEKEQELYNNKAMLSKDSKDKLSVNFMYEPPPGAKKEREREDNEPEYKFEWQRKFNAPREDYCKGDSEIRDQPFGIQVRNVRCIKCHKWGHINTDKECPMYNQSSTSQMLNSSDPLLLIQQMREDGLTIKRSILEAQQHLQVPVESSKRMILSSDEDDSTITQTEKQFLKSLTKKQKLKLLRKLEKLENKKKNGSKNVPSTKNLKKKSKKKVEEIKKKKKKNKNKKKSSSSKKDESTSSSSDNDDVKSSSSTSSCATDTEQAKNKRKKNYSNSSSDDLNNSENGDKQKRSKNNKYNNNSLHSNNNNNNNELRMKNRKVSKYDDTKYQRDDIDIDEERKRNKRKHEKSSTRDRDDRYKKRRK